MNYYQKKKAAIREAAQDWQRSFSSCLWSYGEIADFQARFERLGRKFGLLREFRENGII